MIHKSDLTENIYHKFLENRILSRWFILLIDLSIVTIAALVSYFISSRIYNIIPEVDHPTLHEYILTTVSATFISFVLLRTYVGIVRYSTIHEFQRILFSLLLACIGIFFYMYLIAAPSGSISVVYCTSFLLFSLIGLFFFRTFVIYTFRFFQRKYSGKTVDVFLWGISEDTISMAQFFSASQSIYKVKGYIDNGEPTTLKKNTNHVIVKQNRKNIAKYRVKNILLLSSQNIKDEHTIAEQLIKEGVNFYLMQNFNIENLNDLTELSRSIRPIQIEDLLGRPKIEISRDGIADNINDKIVLVTGAAGSIGCEIVRQLSYFKPKLVICLDQAESPLHALGLELNELKLNHELVIGDVRRLSKLSIIFEKYKPDVVYHAAAYKHVPLMEIEPSEAITTNVKGTKHLVDLSIEHNVEMFVMISTDKAVNPTNVMGASKRIAEIYVQTRALDAIVQNISKTNFVTTRFGNVLGSNGSVIPLFKEQISKGGPITVTHKDITRYFMTIPEACQLVLEASHIGKSGYIYIFDMGEPVKIYDLAVRMIELAGLKPDIDIKIKVSGLRPGEKLYEELLNDSELTEKTAHPKIKIAKVRVNDAKKADALIHRLMQTSEVFENDEVVKIMKLLVPEYVSQNSKYSRFDVPEREIENLKETRN